MNSNELTLWAPSLHFNALHLHSQVLQPLIRLGRSVRSVGGCFFHVFGNIHVDSQLLFIQEIVKPTKLVEIGTIFLTSKTLKGEHHQLLGPGTGTDRSVKDILGGLDVICPVQFKKNV